MKADINKEEVFKKIQIIISDYEDSLKYIDAQGEKAETFMAWNGCLERYDDLAKDTFFEIYELFKEPAKEIGN